MNRLIFIIALFLWLPMVSVLKAQSAVIYIENAPEVYIFLDGKLKGFDSGNGEIIIRDITAGPHTLKFYRSGEIPYEEDVDFQEGEVYVYSEPYAVYSYSAPKRELTQGEVPQVLQSAPVTLLRSELDNIVNGKDTEPERVFEIEEEEEEEVEPVFFVVEDMPRFNGGDADLFRNYVANNLQYPQIALENGISGKVIVQFTVDTHGDVVDAVVFRGVDPALDKEALRVVRSSPKWTPGKQRGKPVNVRFTYPIIFVLQ